MSLIIKSGATASCEISNDLTLLSAKSKTQSNFIVVKSFPPQINIKKVVIRYSPTFLV